MNVPSILKGGARSLQTFSSYSRRRFFSQEKVKKLLGENFFREWGFAWQKNAEIDSFNIRRIELANSYEQRSDSKEACRLLQQLVDHGPSVEVWPVALKVGLLYRQEGDFLAAKKYDELAKLCYQRWGQEQTKKVPPIEQVDIEEAMSLYVAQLYKSVDEFLVYQAEFSSRTFQRKK